MIYAIGCVAAAIGAISMVAAGNYHAAWWAMIAAVWSGLLAAREFLSD